jgi:phage tail-like protein
VRRVRVPSRRGGGPGGPQLPVPAGGAGALVPSAPVSDLRYLEQVVAIPYSLRAARTYLQRHMANPVSFRLVEVRRGETVGVIREIEVRHADGGEKSWIRGERTLPTGEPASFFVPDHLVSIRPKASGALSRGRSLASDDALVLHLPVRGYLRFLPQIFQGEGPVAHRDVVKARGTELQRWRGLELGEVASTEVQVDEDPLRRFLFLFQHVMSSITDQIDRLSELTDPLSCDARFLPWLASWVGFGLDESLPVHQQRELVRRAIRLMRTRGTRQGLEDMVRVLTSAPARVEERVRPPAMILGRGHLIGGKDVVERYQVGEPLGAWLYTPVHPKRIPEPALPADEAVKDVYVPSAERRDTSFFTLRLEPRDRFRGRFGERAGHVLRRIVNVLSQERPSHVQFVVRFEDAPAARGKSAEVAQTRSTA